MEIKTQVEILNEIANKLGDTSPDEMITESQALQNILDHMDGGGGGDNPFFVIDIHRNQDNSVECEYKTSYEVNEAINKNQGKMIVLKETYSDNNPRYRLVQQIHDGLYYTFVNYWNVDGENGITLEDYGYAWPFIDSQPIQYKGYGYMWKVDEAYDPLD